MSAPYKTPNLFGAALDPVLIEDKDKRKVLPSTYRKTDRRFTPYTQRQPFRAYSGPGGPSNYRRSFQATDRYAERQQFHDRGRSQHASKRPFRGSGSRSFRRGK